MSSAEIHNYLDAGLQELDKGLAGHAYDAWEETSARMRLLAGQLGDLTSQAAGVYGDTIDANTLVTANVEDLHASGHNFAVATEGSDSTEAANLLSRQSSAYHQATSLTGPAAEILQDVQEVRDHLRIAIEKLGEAATKSTALKGETGILKADVKATRTAAEDYRDHIRRTIG